jgi:serine/threonine protein kinase
LGTAPSRTAHAPAGTRRLDEAGRHADNHQVEEIIRLTMTDLLAGRYRIDSPLGAGGMGEVFLAHDIKLERRVAIKWLHPDHEQDLVARERLRREALAAAALDHPYICKIHEIGDADGRTFIVMEYVEGETLQVAAGRDLLPVRQIVDIAHELAQALETAHGRGVVHRDLKPSNVMVTTQGHVKVLDFGLARQKVEPATTGTGSDAATRLTDSGIRLGDAGLHVARAGARRRARSPVRHVLARRHRARIDDRGASVPARGRG